MNTMHQIDFEQEEDGTVVLSQEDGIDEPSLIFLHPEQLKFITQSLLGIDPAPAERVANLERHISILADEIDFFFDQNHEQILYCCHDGDGMVTCLDAIRSLAREFDGGRLTPRRCDKEVQQAISDVSVSKPEPHTRDAQETATKEHGDGSSNMQLGLAV